jgi:RNA polymerase sigma-70 factor, ECF subfamily
MNEDPQTNNPRIGFEKESIPHLDLLYNFALRLTGNKNIAYELLQATYVKAFRFYDHLDKTIDFKLWMLRIVRNTYNESFIKKIKTDKTEYSEVENIFNRLDTSRDFAHFKGALFNKINVDELSKAISSLPEDFKMVIVLCDVFEFNYDEIADFVDIPEGTVRSRLHRGRKMLFVKLYNYSVEHGYINKDKSEIG